MAEQKKTAAKKAAPKKPKAEKPAVLTGTVPEWSSTGVIAQMLGFKGCRRVQQLTQDGVLETEVPPGGGARKYRTCETVQRYIAHIVPDGLGGVVLSQAYARGQILESVGRGYLDQSCVEGGCSGVSLAGSSVMGMGDIIDLQVSYRVRPFVQLMGFEGFTMSQCYYGKAWTGYDVTGKTKDDHAEDPMVFITKSGTVYHLNRNCTYLNPSVQAVSAEAVKNLRNESGGRYHSCGSCGRAGAQGQVYITEYGDSYHSQINCSGLKRTIYTVPLSQVGARGRCSKCG